jgi:hypothetical protein
MKESVIQVVYRDKTDIYVLNVKRSLTDIISLADVELKPVVV